MKPAVTEPLPIEGRREVHEDRVENNPSGCQNNLELRLGMALENGLNVDDLNGGSCVGGRGSRYIATKDGLVLHQIEGLCLGGSKRCFSETTGGFVHPWSLAARQEKAALEQAHQNISPCSNVSRAMHPPPAVGWPPIRSFRRNLGVQNQSKSMITSEAKAEVIKVIKQENMQNELHKRTTMFVKVNMEGCTVGRKIDLKLYNGYDSLSHALQKMFHNFFSVNYLNNLRQDEKDDVTSPSYILLYEDNEGDRILVGDVPWELFINSVKRLYITLDPRVHKSGLSQILLH
ncbi:hypothetical protein Cni_G27576 [Canna indica]|uniref:Auxin-responsive protein n=1 Tax=Canna indica TaxID=4628 RepID=A0AAQ3QPG0_9LILI|nr:hypothetical protein Cni_G27576 [Canna indica]